MRIIFMGTAELACPCLEAVSRLSGHDTIAVVTQPDRPKGRHLQPSPSPVKMTAGARNLPVHQPVGKEELTGVVRAAQADLVIVVAYGNILPAALLALPPRGCVNVHASLLPRWRGASPIQHTLLAGDKETGVTTMFMSEKLDAGDILLQRTEPIRADDTSATLHDRLASLGADLLVETVELIADGKAVRTVQDEAMAIYAKKLAKEDGWIDWTRTAVEIERQVRAFHPWPGAQTLCGDTRLRLWNVEVVESVAGAPGEITGDGVVATGIGGLRIRELQPAGRSRMSFEAFARGHRLAMQLNSPTVKTSQVPKERRLT